MPSHKPHKLKLIPLGGLGEVGKNMMILEYSGDIIVIDAGLMFPSEEMPGIDVLIPSIDVLLERRHRIKGIFITHGHEDHIGALPYILSQLDVPVYATKFARELILTKLKRRGRGIKPRIYQVRAGNKVSLGHFRIEFFPVCHSIPDAMGLVISTPVGTIVHSGDFKLDHSPVIGEPTDLGRLAQLGAKGVLALLSDSTYAELSGYTPAEKEVSETLDRIMAEARGRVIITTFASLVSRVQQVLNVSARHKRRVFITGRGMIDMIDTATKAGYLKVPENVFCQAEDLSQLPHDRIVLLATGSQGEPTSALVRIANREHKQIRIVPGDTVVMSATPIPGNEALVNRTVDSLFRQGARVIYGKLAQVHVHGHGSREELKLLIRLVKPRFFVPIHGEYRHLWLHADLARSMGMPAENVFVIEDGDILEFGPNFARVAGKISAGTTYVSGLLRGDLKSPVLKERNLLARDGAVVVNAVVNKRSGELLSEIDIRTRGFVDAPQQGELLEQAKKEILIALRQDKKSPVERRILEEKVQGMLSRFFYTHTHRHPMVLVLIMVV